MELEPSAHPDFTPGEDRRPRMEEPLPVKLLAVADVRLPMSAGLEAEMDRFYVELLGFQVDYGERALVYRADNFRLWIDVAEGLVRRGDYRTLGVEVLSLAETEGKIIAAEIDYTRQKALLSGQESLVLQDPAGNWLQLVEPQLMR